MHRELPDRKSAVNTDHYKSKTYDAGSPSQGMLTKGVYPNGGTSDDSGGSGQRAADPVDGKFKKG